MKKVFTVFGFGFLIWLVPFATGCLMFNSAGELQVEKMLFQSIMILTFSCTACSCAARYFLNIYSNYMQEGIIIGTSWVFISWVLDILVVMPMSQMSIGVYFQEIGIRELMVVFITISMGFVLSRKA